MSLQETGVNWWELRKENFACICVRKTERKAFQMADTSHWLASSKFCFVFILYLFLFVYFGVFTSLLHYCRQSQSWNFSFSFILKPFTKKSQIFPEMQDGHSWTTILIFFIQFLVLTSKEKGYRKNKERLSRWKKSRHSVSGNQAHVRLSCQISITHLHKI